MMKLPLISLASANGSSSTHSPWCEHPPPCIPYAVSAPTIYCVSATPIRGVGTYTACQHPPYRVSAPPIWGVSTHHTGCKHPLDGVSAPPIRGVSTHQIRVVSMFVCVCVRERESARARERERESARARERERESARARERKRERDSESMESSLGFRVQELAHTHTHSQMHTHTRTHARTHAHTHTGAPGSGRYGAFNCDYTYI